MRKLTPHQWRLLNACSSRSQRSTATIQNTTRSLVRLGLIARWRSGGRVLIEITDAGRREWFEHMRAARLKRTAG